MEDFFKHYCDGHVFEVLVYETTGTGSKTALLAESNLLARMEPMFALNNYWDKTED